MNLKLGVVALVPPRSVPRTSSGKVQRSACRAALLAGAFDGAVVNDRALLASLADRCARDNAATDLAAMICGIVAGVCEEADCRPADSLAELGVDSLQAAEAAAVLEDALGLTVPLEAFLLAPTPRGAADALMERWLADGHLAGTVRDRVVTAGNSVGAA
jgi:acyl carrier protein